MKNYLIGLLFVLAGCGSSGESNAPKVNNIQSKTIVCYNQSSKITSDQWNNCVSRIEDQLVTEVNPRWGIDTHVIVGSGTLKVNENGLEMSDKEDPPGAYTVNNLQGHVAYGERTKDIWEADVDHVVLNLANPPYLLGQNFEQYDYHLENGKPVESAPFLLCDFTFPSFFGLPGTFFTGYGQVGQDYLGKK